MAKTAIITGAGRGIGKAIAKRLAVDGCDVVLVDVDFAAAEAAAETIQQETGVKTKAIKCDVSQEEAVQSTVKAVLDEFGTVDVLVNNAGVLSLKKPFEDYEKADWDRIYGINLMGTVYFCKAVLPSMKKNRSGKIINLSSQAAETGGLAASPLYSSSKAAVWCLTKSLAGEMAPYNVCVNALAPGYIVTEMTADAGYQANAVPMKRLGEPEEVADAAAFLASHDARYVTGMLLDVNGGTVMR